MSRILVAASPAPGHVNPLIAIAESLSKRGHRVTFNSADIFRSKAESAGLHFVPLQGKANLDYHLLDRNFPERKTIEPGMPQLNYDMKYIFGDWIPDQYRGIKEIIEGQDIDLLITDFLFLGAFPLLLNSKEPRPPVLACGIAPVLMRTPDSSPFAGPDSTPEGLLRNAEHNREFEELLTPAKEYIDEILQGCGASPTPMFFMDAMYLLPDAFVQPTAAEFEYPMRDKPESFHFVGPALPEHPTSVEEPEWLKQIDGSRPVIFVTQGTIANHDFNQLVNPTMQALADEDVDVIVTADGGDMESIVTTPNSHVEQYLPYHLILPKADIFITNGGYYGVQQALSYGVPVISGGATEDKPFVSARVAWSGVGINLQTGTPTPEQILAAVRQVLDDKKYRDGAKTMQQNYARYKAMDRITEIAEAMIAEQAESVSTSRDEEGILDPAL